MALGLALATIVTFAQPGDRSPFMGGEPAVPHPNFDIRTYKEDPVWEGKADAAEYVEKVRLPAARASDLAVARVTGVALLEAAYRGVRVEHNPAMRTTEVVSAMPGSSLLSAAADDRAAALRGFLTAHADAFGVTAAEVEGLELTADYLNPSGNMGYAEFEQRFHGIPVFQGLIRGGFTAKGELVRTTGVLAAGVDAAALPTTPVLSAAQAVSLAAQTVGLALPEGALVEAPSVREGHVQFGQTAVAGEPSAWLVYFPLEPGVARLAWATQLLGDPEGFLTVLDAETGTMLFRKNLTNYQSQAATYSVYASDSPAPSSPTPAQPGTNFQAPVVSRTSVTLIGNEAPFTFNNLGWMTDGANVTAGNNVEAGLDLVAPDGIDLILAGSPSRVFSATYNPAPGSPAPGDDPSTAAFRSGEIANLFYWSNRFHDLTYNLGFTELSRNFQSDNFGRGGVGGDRVLAQGQDYSGVNNANFLTPADGTSGRMQMYAFTAGTAVDRSSGLDQDVILHELGHGLSNRLHNNGSGLGTTMSGGMGEGWSDFYARALLATSDEDIFGVYTTGGWATYKFNNNEATTDNYYYGIRRFPYAVRINTGGPLNRPHNPLTFADIDPAQIDLTDGAYPRGPIGSTSAFQVHNIGEVWASALFEVRARFILRLGFATGNQRFLQFVTDGMKLDPVTPTLLQGRDSILAAAVAGGNVAADIADIWAGFATRGMGVSASVVNAGTGTVVENFQTPADAVPTFSINDVSAAEGNAGTTNVTFTVTRANPGTGESRVSWATASGTATSNETVVTAPGAITINDFAAATPYPATTVVSGVAGTITSVSVQINGLSHTFPGDLELMLRGPGGQTVHLMSDAGGPDDLVNATLTFRDGAAPVTTGPITPGGTYAPTDLTPFGDSLPSPSPTAPYGATLSVFNGTNPNGIWQLFAADDQATDSGAIAGGFTLRIGTTGEGDYRVGGGQLVFGPGVTTQTVTVVVNGDVVPEPDETFFVNLSAPIAALIGDAQGVGTILNDDGAGVPTTVDDSFATPFATPLTVAAPGVLANDITNSGGAMTAVLVTGASHGTLALGASGGFTYTPDAGFTGADSFTYRASNLAGPGSVATVSLTVGAGVPTTVNDGFATPFATPLTVAAPGVLANDATNGGGAMTAVLVAGVSHGTLALGANGGFTYTPNAGFAGADSFTYRASNSTGPGNVATVTLTVGAGLPTTVGDSFATPFATALTVAAPGLLANDITNGGGAMTSVLVTGVSHGTLALGANGGFTYTPDAGFTGADSFTYRASTSAGPGNVAAVTLAVAVPTTVQPPSNARIDNISGTTVTVRWDAPPVGPRPTGYVLEGGVAPGEVLASLPTGSDGPVFTFAAPVGSFHLRIHALDGATRSGASNEVPLHVVVPVAPSAPTNLTGLVVGDSVALAWKNTFGGGAPTGMVVDVTGSLAVSLPLGPTEGFSFVGVPGGTYTFTMRATNGGGSSPPSNPVTLSFPAACSGTPQAPTNVVAYRLGNTAFVLWDPPASGAAATSYVLNVSGAFNGSFGTPGRALSGVVGPGTYNLSVVGTNACGTGVAAPAVVLVVP